MSAQAPDLISLLRQGLSRLGDARAGFAVSGGGDSMALLHLGAQAGIAAEVATVDHGLRPEAADEAALVQARAAALGLRHETLVWAGRAAQGNLPDAARLARRRLLADWARRRGLGAVVLAHTLDDVAETFLMRLARGAGVDGLAAMAPAFTADGVLFLRPLLAVPRQTLRDWLAGQGLGWVEDPTNRDPAYDRTRARAALAALAPLGLGTGRLAEVAGHMAQARVALEAATEALLRACAHPVGDGLALTVALEPLRAAPQELQRRALVAMLDWLCPRPYAPRGEQVARLAARVLAGQPAQLAGARFFLARGQTWACREAKGDVSGWQVMPGQGELQLRALGAEGLAQCPDWRATGLPRAVLLTAPGLWRGPALIAAPHAGRPAGFRVMRPGAQTVLARRFLSH